MPRHLTSLLATLALIPLAHAQLSDNFDDNSTGPQWSLVTDAPGDLDLTETNARLEATSTPSTNPNNDALYLSDFHLSTASDFEIAIGYSFTTASPQNITGSALTLVFGVGRDLDGTDSAAVGFGYLTREFFGTPISAAGAGGAHRTSDTQTEVVLGFAPDTGTFVITYNTAADRLTLGDGTLSFTLDNKVRGARPGGWNASSLLVSFGIRGSGFTVSPGDATLDNFTVRSGHVLSSPYDFWAAESGLTHAIDDAPSDDPDLDGLTNLDEFALGTDPLAPAAPNITTNLTTTFSVSIPHRNGLVPSGDTSPTITLTGDGLCLALTSSSSLPAGPGVPRPAQDHPVPLRPPRPPGRLHLHHPLPARHQTHRLPLPLRQRLSVNRPMFSPPAPTFPSKNSRASARAFVGFGRTR